jgi:hypothetical protein
MYTTETYCISQATLDKIRCEYDAAFEQAHPRRLNFYVYLAQAHGIVNIVAEGYGFGWQYRATFDNEKSASAFLLRYS